jgi:hypothetical protein
MVLEEPENYEEIHSRRHLTRPQPNVLREASEGKFDFVADYGTDRMAHVTERDRHRGESVEFFYSQCPTSREPILALSLLAGACLERAGCSCVRQHTAESNAICLIREVFPIG